MAIKIQGTTVIDDSRTLSNIAALDATTIATISANAGGGLDTTTTTLATTTESEIGSFAAASHAGVKAFISVVQGFNRQVTEMLITHNGTTAVATEYGMVSTSSELATFDVDINSGNIRILATGTSSTSQDYIVTYTAI